MTLPPAPPTATPAFPTPVSAFGSAPAPAPPVPDRFDRPRAVTVLAVLDVLGGLLYAGVAAVVVLMAFASGDVDNPLPFALIVGGIASAFTALYLAAAIGMWQLRSYGRSCQFVLGILWLLSIPIGTIVGAMAMYYLTRPGVALLFSGRSPASMSPEQRAAVDRDAHRSALVVAVVVVVVGLGVVAILGIIAAIAIPGLLRARMAGNEAVAIGRLRGMSTAQAVYTVSHQGEYGTLDCLRTPALCPPPDGDPPASPYLSAETSGSPASGYTFRLTLAGDRRAFTYWAEPETTGTTGSRAFCLDETGTILQYRGAFPAPPAAGDGCPAGGLPL
jgi:hypothetical protein